MQKPHIHKDPGNLDNISKHLIRINNNSMYKPCGLWIPKPKNWDSTKTIAQSKLEFKDKSF